eukprot:scaffold200414_cov33-Prasinocladus_malaysianus.AAC.1
MLPISPSGQVVKLRFGAVPLRPPASHGKGTPPASQQPASADVLLFCLMADFSCGIVDCAEGRVVGVAGRTPWRPDKPYTVSNIVDLRGLQSTSKYSTGLQT